MAAARAGAAFGVTLFPSLLPQFLSWQAIFGHFYVTSVYPRISVTSVGPSLLGVFGGVSWARMPASGAGVPRYGNWYSASV